MKDRMKQVNFVYNIHKSIIQKNKLNELAGFSDIITGITESRLFWILFLKLSSSDVN